jgi:hypothetical protein
MFYNFERKVFTDAPSATDRRVVVRALSMAAHEAGQTYLEEGARLGFVLEMTGLALSPDDEQLLNSIQGGSLLQTFRTPECLASSARLVGLTYNGELILRDETSGVAHCVEVEALLEGLRSNRCMASVETGFAESQPWLETSDETCPH